MTNFDNTLQDIQSQVKNGVNSSDIKTGLKTKIMSDLMIRLALK